jgi:hypothetical protein
LLRGKCQTLRTAFPEVVEEFLFRTHASLVSLSSEQNTPFAYQPVGRCTFQFEVVAITYECNIAQAASFEPILHSMKLIK